MNKVIVFAGTTEGRRICEFLASNEVLVTACVATEYGSLVMPEMSNLIIKEGRLSLEEIEEIITPYDYIIDATHPFAKIISKNIKLAVKKKEKKYLRIVRPYQNFENIIEVSSIREACEFLNKTTGNVLITTGSKELEPYTDVNSYKERLFLRVLPTLEALNECKRLSFRATNIICMQGPFTENINKAMLEQINAEYLITKETGNSGGFYEKLMAAKHLGVKVIVIGRPTVEDGLDYESAIIFLKDKFNLTEKNGSHFPLFINLKGKKILIIGAGAIATRRVEALLRFDANITVVAPEISRNLNSLYEQGKISILKKEYEKKDILNAYMIISTTNERAVNNQVFEDAKQLNILVNIADNKEQSEFFFPAIFFDKDIIGGLISIGGKNHKIAKIKASEIRSFLSKGEQSNESD